MKQIIKIKVDPTKLPNELHFNVQRTYRCCIHKPKKGRGSFRRNKQISLADFN